MPIARGDNLVLRLADFRIGMAARKIEAYLVADTQLRAAAHDLAVLGRYDCVPALEHLARVEVVQVRLQARDKRHFAIQRLAGRARQSRAQLCLLCPQSIEVRPRSGEAI